MARSHPHPTQQYHYPYSAFALGVLNADELQTEIIKTIREQPAEEYEAAYLQLPVLVTQFGLPKERARQIIHRLQDLNIQPASSYGEALNYFLTQMEELRSTPAPSQIRRQQPSASQEKLPASTPPKATHQPLEQALPLRKKASKRKQKKASASALPNTPNSKIKSNNTKSDHASPTKEQPKKGTQMARLYSSLSTTAQRSKKALYSLAAKTKGKSHPLLQKARSIAAARSRDTQKTAPHFIRLGLLAALFLFGITTAFYYSSSPSSPIEQASTQLPSRDSNQLTTSSAPQSLKAADATLNLSTGHPPTQTKPAPNSSHLQQWHDKGQALAKKFHIGPAEEPERALYYLALLKQEAPKHPLTAKLLLGIAQACRTWGDRLLKSTGDSEKRQIYIWRAKRYEKEAADILKQQRQQR